MYKPRPIFFASFGHQRGHYSVALDRVDNIVIIEQYTDLGGKVYNGIRFEFTDKIVGLARFCQIPAFNVHPDNIVTFIGQMLP